MPLFLQQSFITLCYFRWFFALNDDPILRMNFENYFNYFWRNEIMNGRDSNENETICTKFQRKTINEIPVNSKVFLFYLFVEIFGEFCFVFLFNSMIFIAKRQMTYSNGLMCKIHIGNLFACMQINLIAIVWIYVNMTFIRILIYITSISILFLRLLYSQN